MSEIMLDLETLSTKNDACIISIGAVLFDPKGDAILSTFERRVNPMSCQDVGLHIDATTVMWWMHPDRAAAREVLLSGVKVSIEQALMDFNDWFGPSSIPLWGNGATFDNVILRNAYEACGLMVPWAFYHDRCYRTMKSLHPEVPFERTGVYHSAVDDAASQALHLQRILKGANA